MAEPSRTDGQANLSTVPREYRPPMTSTNSGPAIAKKGTWASVATALARSVFPQPGGPSNSAPFGTLAPS